MLPQSKFCAVKVITDNTDA